MDPVVEPEGCGVVAYSRSKDLKCVAGAAALRVDDDEPSGGFDCNICLDMVQDPVVTLCGHLYCWPCIHRWLQVQGTAASHDLDTPSQPQCPVCKAEVSKETLVPLYGRGGSAKPSKSKAHNLGIMVPRRPVGPACGISSPRTTRRQLQQQQQQQPIYHNSPLENPQTTAMIGEMVLARVLGSPCAYQNSYNHAGMSSPRVRRHVMETDKSLSRICVFLFYCLVLCLLLF